MAEPWFILKASDPHAATLVNLWSAMKRLETAAMESAPAIAEAKQRICDAEAKANEMVAWRCEHLAGEADPSGVRTVAQALVVFAELAGATVVIRSPDVALVHGLPIVQVRPKP